jgi:AGZA family xanthine/uracil permease-like MFS transporter
VLGGGAIIGGLILAAIAAFVIDRAFLKAAAFAGAGAVLTFFGFMHGEAIGFAESPVLALSYLGVAAGLLACAKLPALTFTSAAAEVPHGAAVEAAE